MPPVWTSIRTWPSFTEYWASFAIPLLRMTIVTTPSNLGVWAMATDGTTANSNTAAGCRSERRKRMEEARVGGIGPTRKFVWYRARLTTANYAAGLGVVPSRARRFAARTRNALY